MCIHIFTYEKIHSCTGKKGLIAIKMGRDSSKNPQNPVICVILPRKQISVDYTVNIL